MNDGKYQECCVGLLFLCYYIENYLDRKHLLNNLKLSNLIELKTNIQGKEKEIYSKLLDAYFRALKDYSKLSNENTFSIHKDCISSTAATQVAMENDIEFDVMVNKKFKLVIKNHF